MNGDKHQALVVLELATLTLHDLPNVAALWLSSQPVTFLSILEFTFVSALSFILQWNITSSTVIYVRCDPSKYEICVNYACI
jgi:hypothetical protein